MGPEDQARVSSAYRLTALVWAMTFPRLSVWTDSIDRIATAPPGTSPIVR